MLFFILAAAPLIVPLLYFSYYDATVDNISDDLSTCTVSFDKYGNTEIVKVSKCTKGSEGKREYVCGQTHLQKFRIHANDAMYLANFDL